MKFVMTVNMNGAAFQDNYGELKKLVSETALLLDDNAPTRRIPLIDTNGNVVGYAQVTEGDIDKDGNDTSI